MRPALAGDNCTGIEGRLVGSWEQVGDAGFFEEMAFAIEGRKRVFHS